VGLLVLVDVTNNVTDALLFVLCLAASAIILPEGQLPVSCITMATLNRRPLANRPLAHNVSPSRSKLSCIFSGAKRPRSPERAENIASHPSAKRVKASNSAAGHLHASNTSVPRDVTKERNRLEREAEFREKYTRAFPGWTFYFEEGRMASQLQERLEDAIEQLGGVRLVALLTHCENITIPSLSVWPNSSMRMRLLTLSRIALSPPVIC
jgi:hypothetical protein